MNKGIELIAAERERQIKKEGWTAKHDRQHNKGELSIAAACYAVNKLPTPVPEVLVDDKTDPFRMIDAWPFDQRWDKRKKHDRLRSLAIAGALIAAEIDRLTAIPNA